MTTTSTQRRIRVAAAFSLATVAAGGGLLVGRSPANADTAPFVPLPDAAHQALGVGLARHTGPALISGVTATTARTLADARVGLANANSAGSVSIAFGDFSDDEYYTDNPDGSRTYVATQRPAFLVTYDGVHVPHRGPSATTSSEMVVAVDAQSGDIIEAFSYR